MRVKNRLDAGNNATPEGFIAKIKAGATTLSTSSAWKSSNTEAQGWEQPGFDDTAWTPAKELADYGGGPWGANVSLPPAPSPYLRKDFTADKEITQARLYVSALGVYEVHINGQKVGDQVLAPGWTEYSKRVPSQTYDVTSLVKQGENAIGAILGGGWYSTRLQGGKMWGTSPALLAQLKLTYADGTTSRITTDNTWTAGEGGVRASGIYDGETYDARFDHAGWDQPGFSGGWSTAVERNETMAVEPSTAPPIKVIATLQPKKVTTPTPARPSTTSARTSPAGRGSRPPAPRARRSSCASGSSSTTTARSTRPTCAPPSRRTPTRSRAAARRPTRRTSPTTASATSR